MKFWLRNKDVDYDAKGLMRTEDDDRIIADIPDFNAENPNDEVILFSDDYTMRMRRRRFAGLTIISSGVAIAGRC